MLFYYKTFEDKDRDGNFLKPNEYFEPEIKIDEMKVYPEHVQYAAQYMRLDLSLFFNIFQMVILDSIQACFQQ